MLWPPLLWFIATEVAWFFLVCFNLRWLAYIIKAPPTPDRSAVIYLPCYSEDTEHPLSLWTTVPNALTCVMSPVSFPTSTVKIQYMQSISVALYTLIWDSESPVFPTQHTRQPFHEAFQRPFLKCCRRMFRLVHRTTKFSVSICGRWRQLPYTTYHTSV